MFSYENGVHMSNNKNSQFNTKIIRLINIVYYRKYELNIIEFDIKLSTAHLMKYEKKIKLNNNTYRLTEKKSHKYHIFKYNKRYLSV